MNMNGRRPNEKQGERIAKVMARAGLCSRREAEAWIAAGRVAVNGAVLTSPACNVARGDRVQVDGKALPSAERTRLFRYHKPRGLMSTSRDPQGRPTLFERLPKELPRLVSIGRLDMTSEGLLLLTNDGGLKRALELPETGWLRRYRVRANGKTTQEQLDALKRGITVEGVAYGPIEAKLDRAQGANVWLTVGMREGKNREVRKALGALGLTVNRLIRISYGPFQLLDLEPGAIEEVPTRVLREQISARIARAAGVDFAAPVRVMERPAPERSAPSPRTGSERSRRERRPKRTPQARRRK
jgi:23S rRNA pseudouridine2605 synthase